MNTVMGHNFAASAAANIQRSQFSRNHGLKTTFDAGYLVPIFVDEVLPGDTMNLNMSTFCRLATPLHPIMDNLFLDTFFFFVPNRLLWENWERFNGAQDDPADSTSFTIPIMNTGVAVAEGSLGDYFGLPTGVTGVEYSSLPFRAYNLIYNEWFRDENLQDSAYTYIGDANTDLVNYPLLRRGKRHDYFTSCLPWPQKGADVSLPLGVSAPVVTDGNPLSISTFGGAAINLSLTSGTTNVDLATNALASGNAFFTDTGLQADLSAATSATVNQLREAMQIQQLYERDARGGTRYVELIKSHFGVVSPDFRMQRPEFLGGGQSSVNINAIAQTSETATTPQGTLAAMGTMSGNNHGFTKSFVEHGVIIGMASLRADLTYQQGIDRMWSRETREDFYWPSLAHLGEQAVLNKEIYCDGTAADNNVFGYQERYAEYRFKPSKITGSFRSSAAASLDIWHLSQDFGALPLLNDTFIQDNPPLDRCIATPTEPHVIGDFYFDYKCARPMPVNSIPAGFGKF